jgi:hypothetical protein
VIQSQREVVRYLGLLRDSVAQDLKVAVPLAAVMLVLGHSPIPALPFTGC